MKKRAKMKENKLNFQTKKMKKKKNKWNFHTVKRMTKKKKKKKKKKKLISCMTNKFNLKTV